MGYRPNPMLAALASKRFSNAKAHTDTPLAILDFPTLPGQPARHASQYKQVLMDEATRLGYMPYHHLLTPESNIAPLFRQLYARSTEGIIITGNVDISTLDRAFDWNQFSVVQCARYLNRNPFHRVRPNIFQSIKLAFTEVRKRGYQRIGCAPGRHPVMLEDDEDRLGAALAMETSYLSKKNQLPVYMGAIEDRPALINWYRKNKPDVILGFNSCHYWALYEVGVSMPGDVGFALLHQAELQEKVSGLSQNLDVIARQSVQLLDQLIRNHERGPSPLPMDILVPSSWQDGTTLRPMEEVKA